MFKVILENPQSVAIVISGAMTLGAIIAISSFQIKKMKINTRQFEKEWRVSQQKLWRELEKKR